MSARTWCAKRPSGRSRCASTNWTARRAPATSSPARRRSRRSNVCKRRRTSPKPREEMAQRFTANHAAVAAHDAQIAALQGVLGKMGKSVQTLPDTEQTALRLLRDVHVDTELYTNLLNSAQQLRIAKAGQVGDVRVVDFAEAADDPVRPKRLLVILISLAGGLILGIVVAFIRKALYGGRERPEEIATRLGLPAFPT